jgi:hypothetical protein
MPKVDLKPLEEIFRARVFKMLNLSLRPELTSPH